MRTNDQAAQLTFVVSPVYFDWGVPALACLAREHYYEGLAVGILGIAVRFLFSRKLTITVASEAVRWTITGGLRRRVVGSVPSQEASPEYWNAAFSSGVELYSAQQRVLAATRHGSVPVPSLALPVRARAAPLRLSARAMLLCLPNAAVLAASGAYVRDIVSWVSFAVGLGAVAGIGASIATMLRGAPSILLATEADPAQAK